MQRRRERRAQRRISQPSPSSLHHHHETPSGRGSHRRCLTSSRCPPSRLSCQRPRSASSRVPGWLKPQPDHRPFSATARRSETTRESKSSASPERNSGTRRAEARSSCSHAHAPSPAPTAPRSPSAPAESTATASPVLTHWPSDGIESVDLTLRLSTPPQAAAALWTSPAWSASPAPAAHGALAAFSLLGAPAASDSSP
eukprot:scaffold263_cov120-Isochrysis_galbana.AAC.17